MSQTAQKTKNRKNAPKLPEGTWLTKYGTRRVRQEGPTLEEAIFAARGLTDDENQQIEVAASLMGLPVNDVREAMLKFRAPRRAPAATFAFSGRAGAERAVVVERKPTRRPLTRTSWGASA